MLRIQNTCIFSRSDLNIVKGQHKSIIKVNCNALHWNESKYFQVLTKLINNSAARPLSSLRCLAYPHTRNFLDRLSNRSVVITLAVILVGHIRSKTLAKLKTATSGPILFENEY